MFIGWHLVGEMEKSLASGIKCMENTLSLLRDEVTMSSEKIFINSFNIEVVLIVGLYHELEGKLKWIFMVFSTKVLHEILEILNYD